MTSVARAIFRAIHEGKWLSIEYRNKSGQTTRFWIAIKLLNPLKQMLTVDGLHLHDHTVEERYLYISSILTAAVVEGTWCARNEALVTDIDENPHKYEALFSNVANLKILDYLSTCNKLDSTPYKTEYKLVHRIDEQQLSGGSYALSEEQFREIVSSFQQKAVGPHRPGEPLRMKQLGLNVLSLDTRQGLYVLAYRPLSLDVKGHALRAGEDVVLCKEFSLDRSKAKATQSIRYYLDAEDLDLLDDFAKNQERIKDLITLQNPELGGVNDMPYLVVIGRDCITDLDNEYNGILDLLSKDEDAVPVPLRAFFGALTTRARRRPAVPLTLLDDKINLDQLLAMNHAMRNPLAYVQGPPGTGKTNTILNILVTAFFNEKTVLFASYNNHPIDSVVEKLQTLQYHGTTIPFPILRLGNNQMMAQAIDTMRDLYQRAQSMKVFEAVLDRSRKERTARATQLTRLLERYEGILDLQERRETVQRLLESRSHLNFQFELTNQLDEIDRQLTKAGTVTTEDALPLLDRNAEELYRYLHFTSARFLRRINEEKNEELLKIITAPQEAIDLVADFNHYLSNQENLKKLLGIFPIVAITCSSAYKLGDPKPLFDMVIMDEASQCNTAVSLVPILRGKSLLLVGDPQQLSPVVVLDSKDNEVLRRRYNVTQEYDYIENSVYKCFLACDSLSDEVLLSYHYRCDPRIIEFNNRKYYNNRLHIASRAQEQKPLIYVDIPKNTTVEKNTAPQEVQPILRYLHKYPEKSVGIITPFARQRALIEQNLRDHRLEQQATCGTVHAFQGDEKDVIIFSLGITDRTGPKTYGWLKNNKELINVAVSRARQQLIILSSSEELERLHADDKDDDLYELVQYVKTNGVSEVTEKPANSRALGIKPYSTKTEDLFLENLNHALDNALMDGSRCVVHKEVPIAQVFQGNTVYPDYFFMGRFDFVVYQRSGRQELPLLAIELDGKEHHSDLQVQQRDRKKEAICRQHGFELIRVENSYARRYHYIKDVLIRYFKQSR